jgi:tetratricopeptide (TPR) repeat protein
MPVKIGRETALELCKTITASALFGGSLLAKVASPVAGVEAAVGAATLIAALGQERAQQVESIISRMADQVVRESETWIGARGPGAAARREQALPVVQRIAALIEPTGPELVRLGLDRERIVAFYLKRAAKLDGGAIFSDAPEYAVARELLADIIGYTFDAVRHLPEIQPLALGALLDRTEHIETKVEGLSKEVAEQVLAGMDARFMRDAEQRGLERGTILTLARRLKPEEALDFDQAVRELENAVRIALDVIARGERGSNVGELIDAVLRRVAEQTKLGAFDKALAVVDTAIAELDRRDLEYRESSKLGRSKLLESAIGQEILRRDALGVAGRVSALIANESGENIDAGLRLFREHYDRFIAEGMRRGINFSLEVCIALAKSALSLAVTSKPVGDWRVLLGIALFSLGERESNSARLESAVSTYRAALQEHTRESAPLAWAMTQNNLGYALQRLGERESGTERLEEAVAAYRAALQEFVREREPLDWAGTHNNLGNALKSIGEREVGTARLEEAVKVFRAALEERTRERVPLDWASTQNNLGNALQTLGERENNTARLEEAVSAFRAALEESTRNLVPLDWAGTHNNLGNALKSLGEREGGTVRLVEAICAFRTALEEITQERMPLDWAGTQSNLGSALRLLGERQTGTAQLEEAVAAYRAALKECNRERTPFVWAMAQNNLGNALRSLGERERGTARIEEAAVAFSSALEEWRPDNASHYHTIATQNLALAEILLAQRQIKQP